MSHTNSKNLLQKYCQKNSLILPEYATIQAKEGGYFTTIKLWDKNVYKSQIFSTKKKAEFDAATLALKSLTISSSKTMMKADKITFILIDYENLNQKKLIEEYEWSPLITPLFFVSKLHSLSYKDGFETVDSCIKDAVDVAIIMKTAELLTTRKDIYKIIILTRDHFAGAIVDICKYKFPTTIVEHISSIENLCNFFAK